MIRWRGENDKIGFEHETPLTGDAVAALDAARAFTNILRVSANILRILMDTTTDTIAIQKRAS